MPKRVHPPAVILFIGDGMGKAHRTAARWSSLGQNGALVMDSMPFGGWTSTASADSPVTDSAAAATALATGVKTNNRTISMDPDLNVLTTLLERAQARGMAVGLVTNVQMAHATPAAFAAHVESRYNMTEIARQMLETKVDVLLGGGEDEFLPTTATGCYAQSGERNDGRNLINEAITAGYIYVCHAAELDAVNPISTTRLLGLFADEGMPRPFSPTLAQMTQKALDILSQDPDGFFLMVEGGQIDWASHANDAANAISDTVDFDKAVAVAQTYALTAEDTLIIVTADHETGGMSVSLTAGGTLDQDGPFFMPDGTPFYVDWSTTGHTADDVPTTAGGPWSDLLTGTYPNTHIHDVMLMALQSSPLITLTQVAAPSPGTAVRPGDWITYTVAIVNGGERAHDVVLSDTLDLDNVTLVVSHTTRGALSGPNPVQVRNPELDPDQRVTLTLGVTVTGAINGTFIRNRASLTSTEVSSPRFSNRVTHVIRHTDGTATLYLPLLFKGADR